MTFNIDNIDTCDIILFKGTSIFGRILEYLGKSRYSHVGIILKNPKFLNEKLEDGIYILESSYNNTPDSEDNAYKLGVQIHRLEDVLKEYNSSEVYIRHVKCNRDDNFYKKLNDIHKEIHNKPYDLDISDWILAKYNLDIEISPNPSYKKTKEFWCSALVSYIFKKMELINNDINWTLIAPREFSSYEGKYLNFSCEVEQEIILDKKV